jgi:hypothetical protein
MGQCKRICICIWFATLSKGGKRLSTRRKGEKGRRKGGNCLIGPPYLYIGAGLGGGGGYAGGGWSYLSE